MNGNATPEEVAPAKRHRAGDATTTYSIPRFIADEALRVPLAPGDTRKPSSYHHRKHRHPLTDQANVREVNGQQPADARNSSPRLLRIAQR